MLSDSPSHPIEPNPGASLGSEEISQAPEGAVASASQPASQRSNIWDHFKKAADCPSSKRATCVHCSRRYVCSSGGTVTPWRHIKKMHPRKLNSPATVGPLDSFLGAGSGAAIDDPGTLRQMLLKWALEEFMPFTAVDSPLLRKAIRLGGPNAAVPSARTMKRDAMSMFEAEKARVRTLLQEVPGKLSLTSPPSTSDTNAFQWWKASARAYPCLAEVVKDYLVMPASRAAVERVFSGGADLVDDKRGSLSAETIRICTCLESW